MKSLTRIYAITTAVEENLNFRLGTHIKSWQPVDNWMKNLRSQSNQDLRLQFAGDCLILVQLKPRIELFLVHNEAD